MTTNIKFEAFFLMTYGLKIDFQNSYDNKYKARGVFLNDLQIIDGFQK